MLNVLSFTYMHPEMVNRAAQMLLLGSGGLFQLDDRYVLFMHEDINSIHDCPIHEIIYDDFVNFRFVWPLQRLQEIEALHTKEEIETVFPRSDEGVKRKVLNTINFALDKVYKSEKLLIAFMERIKTSPPIQGVPNAIYSVIQENFKILQENTAYGRRMIVITRKQRSEEHGNDASGGIH